MITSILTINKEKTFLSNGKQGISTGSVTNDGTGDTPIGRDIKINNNFNEIYDKFGDGTNLVSFVSFASTAGYSTNCGIASTSVLAWYGSECHRQY